MSNTHISFAQRLKEENRTTHDSVDYLVMSVAPFADIAAARARVGIAGNAGAAAARAGAGG